MRLVRLSDTVLARLRAYLVIVMKVARLVTGICTVWRAGRVLPVFPQCWRGLVGFVSERI